MAALERCYDCQTRAGGEEEVCGRDAGVDSCIESRSARRYALLRLLIEPIKALDRAN